MRRLLRRRRKPLRTLGDYAHHSQNDRWAAEIAFPGLRGGFFVEAGACGGHLGSATFALEQDLGWDGICVEPLDEYFEILQRLRTCRTDPRCLTGSSGEAVEFLSFTDFPARSGILALNKNEAWAAEHDRVGETMTKETVTLSDLLEQHDAPPTVHYLCLDVEGAELEILEPYDFAADRRILAISVEGESCNAMLRDGGYIEVRNPFQDRLIDFYFVHPTISDEVVERTRAAVAS